MKIAQVCPYDVFGLGGVPQVVTHLAKGLIANGHEVKIITPRPAKHEGDAPNGYIFLGNSRKMSAGLSTAGDVGIETDGNEIDELLKREQFDVINFHEPWLPHLSRQIIQKSNAAHVSTFHASLSDSLAGKSILNVTPFYWKVILDKTQIITAVSEAASAGLMARQPKNPKVKRLRYIPNGIDLARYQKSAEVPKHPHVKTILYVGRLEGRKGVKYLLNAYNELAAKHDDVQLYIAGQGIDEEKLRDYVKENQIPKVTFLGFISDEDKINYLHRADLFCAPAHKGESFGIVLLEAMAAACPIVAGDNAGYVSVMKGTGAVSLANPLDTIDFARKMELMLYDDEIRRIWKEWAADYVKQFDWAPIVRQYEDTYLEAIALHDKKRA